MPMSRPQKNAMRSAKGPGTTPNNMGKGLGKASVESPTGGGTPNKQYTQTGKKYSGPNYPQADKSTAKYGKSGLK